MNCYINMFYYTKPCFFVLFAAVPANGSIQINEKMANLIFCKL